MVLYSCDKCSKVFNQKSKYLRHQEKKIPCTLKKPSTIQSDHNYRCDICDKQFSRPDVLQRHLETASHKNKVLVQNNDTELVQTNIDTTNANAQVNPIGDNAATNAGDHNNAITGTNNLQIAGNKHTVNNYYFIAPFGESEIDKLTTQDKIKIFMSKDNPIITIIIMTNLNPLLYQYHNVGYTDMKSGHGYIFNGKTWEKKNIQSILDQLLSSKRDDLLEIYKDIKHSITAECDKSIRKKLENVQENVEPHLDYQFKSKKILTANLKTKFSNGSTIVTDAIKKSGKPFDNVEADIDDEIQHVLKDGLTFADVDKAVNDKRMALEVELRPKKEQALYLLDEIFSKLTEWDEWRYQSITRTIKDLTRAHEIDTTIKLLCKSYAMDEYICTKTIIEKIRAEREIDEYMFGRKPKVPEP